MCMLHGPQANRYYSLLQNLFGARFQLSVGFAGNRQTFGPIFTYLKVSGTGG